MCVLYLAPKVRESRYAGVLASVCTIPCIYARVYSQLVDAWELASSEVWPGLAHVDMACRSMPGKPYPERRSCTHGARGYL